NPRGGGHRIRRTRYNRQVFGLAGTGPSADLLAVASQAVRPVLMTAFVLAHRCGTVPDFHRIPSHPPVAGFDAGPIVRGSGSTGRRTSCAVHHSPLILPSRRPPIQRAATG